MPRHEHVIFANEPAKCFNEAYPIGCGKLGAMIYGDTHHFKMSLNHDELWSGTSREGVTAHYDKAAYPEARNLALEGKYQEAQAVLEERVDINNGAAYLPLGDLYIDIKLEDVSHYFRELDIQNSVARVSFFEKGAPVTIEAIASYDSNVIAIRFHSEIPLDVSVSKKVHLSEASIVSGNRITYFGTCPTLCERQIMRNCPLNYLAEDKTGIRFASGLELECDGEWEIKDGKYELFGVKCFALYVSAETSFKDGNERGKEDYKELLSGCLDAARELGYKEIYFRHFRSVRSLYDRTSLSFSSESGKENLPTSERIKAFNENSCDWSLIALAFNFSKYLLISTSREGSQAPNLQGVWNEEMNAPWCSNYTTNINLEMNYWSALPLGLSELLSPYEKLVERIAEAGREAARDIFSASGASAHHNSDIFGYAEPGFKNCQWSYFPVGFAWLVRELFNKYEYTRDGEYLEKIYSLLSDSAEFFLDTLVFDGEYLILAPGTSAENSYLDERGNLCSVAKSSTVFASIVREAISNFIAASEILGKESELVNRAKEAFPKLLPLRITEDGRIEEWYFGGKSKSPVEPEPTHRHISHLYDLYPAKLININTPELFSAAKESLRVRGDNAMGWSLIWKLCCNARLRNSDGVMHFIKMFFRPISPANEKAEHGGGVYPNLLCAPPFQIDGNLGFAAAISEMLVSELSGEITALPALPREIKNGTALGIRIPGAKRVNLEWRDGEIIKFEIIDEKAK